ncbi:hypothetical protein KDX31_05795 [Amphritea atlantica]|uniref:Uncharacterized protein n=1 Tax=Amphritea atlantica TaxID=355243 RepID=A0ABY5GYL6_9GAMM|nr:hypothetical protein KDX31_05795 [Amphritea atlantica]
MRFAVLFFATLFLSTAFADSPKVQELERRIADLEAAVPIKVVMEPEASCTDRGQFADWTYADGSPVIVDFGWCPSGTDTQFFIRHEEITPTAYVRVLDSSLEKQWAGCEVFTLWDGQIHIECLRGYAPADAVLIMLIVP